MNSSSSSLTADEHAVLVAKVERLWRKARSSTFPAETQAYEEKALYLMARARITQAMLDLDGSGSDSIEDAKIGAVLAGGYRIPAETIFSAVARAFGCSPYLYTSGRQSQPAAVGFSTDLDRVRFLWPLLHSDAMSAAAQLKGRTAAQTSALRRSSMFGYSQAITERFDAINAMAATDADGGVDQSEAEGPLARDVGKSDSVGPTALMVRDRAEMVAEAFAELSVGTRSRRVSGGYGGHDHGHAAGMAADLTGGSRSVRGQTASLSR